MGYSDFERALQATYFSVVDGPEHADMVATDWIALPICKEQPGIRRVFESMTSEGA